MSIGSVIMSLLSLLMLVICVFSLSCSLCLCVCLCLWLSLFPPHVYGSVLIFLTSKQLITRGGLSANLWISTSVQVSLLRGSSCSLCDWQRTQAVISVLIHMGLLPEYHLVVSCYPCLPQFCTVNYSSLCKMSLSGKPKPTTDVFFVNILSLIFGSLKFQNHYTLTGPFWENGYLCHNKSSVHKYNRRACVLIFFNISQYSLKFPYRPMAHIYF